MIILALIKKREFLLASYYEFKKIDKTLEKEIKKETFSKFRVNL